MNIFKLAAEIFLIYLLYKLIFNFIIPIYNSTKQIRKQFSDVQSKMKEEMNRQQNTQPQQPTETIVNNVEDEDYIEFEEIKS